MPDARPHATERIHLCRCLLACADNAESLSLFWRQIFRRNSRSCADPQCRDGMIMDNTEQVTSLKIPYQHETRDVAPKYLSPAVAVLHKRGLGGIDTDRCYAVAGHRARYDIHPEPTLLALFLLWQRETATRQHSRPVVAKFAERFFGQRNSLAH